MAGVYENQNHQIPWLWDLRICTLVMPLCSAHSLPSNYVSECWPGDMFHQLTKQNRSSSFWMPQLLVLQWYQPTGWRQPQKQKWLRQWWLYKQYRMSDYTYMLMCVRIQYTVIQFRIDIPTIFSIGGINRRWRMKRRRRRGYTYKGMYAEHLIAFISS